METLADKKAEYEAENQDTVDMLFSMIEFDEFKKKMIVAKKGCIDSEGTEKDDEAIKEYQKLQIEDEWGTFQKYLAEDLNDKSVGWYKKVNMSEFKNGYKCQIW